MQGLRFAVLLRQGTFEVVECGDGDLFHLARCREAGICGVFEDLSAAEKFIAEQREIVDSQGVSRRVVN